jgi:hypothetical protein
MLMVMLSARKLENLWKDNFTVLLFTLLKGRRIQAAVKHEAYKLFFNTQSAFRLDSEFEFRMILRIRGKHWISRLAFVTERQ